MDDEYYLLREATLLLRHQKKVEAAQLYEKLGELFTKRTLFQKALAAYQKALSLSADPQMYRSISTVYENLNQTYLAEEALSHVQIKTPPPELKKGDKILEPLKSPSKKSSSVDDVIEALEKDLGIKIETPFEAGKPSPFHLKTPLEELSAESLLELSIGYKEMGLFKSAIEYLKNALTLANNPSLELTCTHVLGLCYLESHLYFDCISLLEKTLQQNLSLPKELRLELLYTLSSAYELSGNDGKSLSCLRQIEKEEKFYRDIADRIKRIRGKNTF